MARYRDRQQDDEADENKCDILSNGQSLRVPTYLMDSLKRAVAGVAADDLSLSRPGWRTSTDAAASSWQRARDEAYIKMVEGLATAYLTPAQRAAATERACELGRDAALSMGDAQQIRDRAYQAMCQRLQDAWKTS